MKYIPTSKNTLSSHSSTYSVVTSALQTPSDTQHPSPLNTFVACEMPSTMFSPRLELFPTSPTSALDSSMVCPQTAGAHSKYASHEDSHHTRRMRRGTIESMSSRTSQSSHRSLLRRTLLLVTSSISSSKPYSVIATPGLLTPCTSASSLASSSLDSPTASLPPNRRPVDKVLPRPRPISSSSQKFARGISLAAEPTTALTPINTNSLAQFTPTPYATSTLRQFGVPASSSRVQGALNVAIGRNRSSHRHVPGSETSRRRSRDMARRASNHDDSGFTPKKATSPTGWLLYPGRNLPSIARTLASDSLKPSTSATATTTNSSSGGLNIPGTWDARIVTPCQEITATPRPAFPIESKAQVQWPRLNEDAVQPVGVDKGKGKATAPAKAAHLQQRFALQRSSSAPTPPIASIVGRISPTASAMAREKKFDSNLPSLAAIESGSRLMRSKIVCATCNEAGPDFPRCGRCGEAWCSRACRVEANKESGGKHRCSPSVA